MGHGAERAAMIRRFLNVVYVGRRHRGDYRYQQDTYQCQRAAGPCHFAKIGDFIQTANLRAACLDAACVNYMSFVYAISRLQRY
jgi:hypothetical protein